MEVTCVQSWVELKNWMHILSKQNGSLNNYQKYEVYTKKM